MNSQRLPKSDSIHELAAFWDTHDLADFEDQLEEVADPVFDRENRVTVRLQSDEAEALRAMARARGLAESDLVHQWVRERLGKR